jgi:flagellar assembly protein FliH
VEYAQLQAELILRQARVDGEKLMEKMKEDAIREAELIHAGARDEGYREGYAKGMADAMEEGARSREEEKIHMEEQASRLEEEVKRFLEKASLAQEEMIYQTQDELLDLVMAVAEKIIRVSLKSSSEIIVRMLQTATEKLKHQEWVYIYITGCDARTMAQISPALTATLGALSDNIRIVPMGDDEVGTCIIETPEGMIDASVSTQLSNMRDILKSSAGTMSTP